MSRIFKIPSLAVFSFLTFCNLYSQDIDSLQTSSDITQTITQAAARTIPNETKSDSLVSNTNLSSEDKQKTDTMAVTFHPNTGAQLEVLAVKTHNGKINTDGVLNEPEWKTAAKLTNFSEIYPGDNIKPPVETELYILYDDDNIHLGYICYDNDMKNLHATFCDRDKNFRDDFAGIFIDTYSDSKQAYEILTNPYGIQGDLLWSNGNEDASYDAIWYSGAKIYNDRWTCEITIPFKSIRFPNKDVQDWKIHPYRVRPRNNRDEYFWCPVSRDDPSLFSKSGTLKGLKAIRGGDNLEVLPYVLGSQSGQLQDLNNANSKFENNSAKGEFGVNLKYGITSNLTSDFALNPDFSQVESDAGVININSNFALFYPERRPFFLEGSNIFSTPFDVVYTRSINKPYVAGKLTGKIGKFDVGYITAYDEKTPFLVPLHESSNIFSTDIKSLSNIVRVKRDLKDDSYLGFIFTDREYKHGSTTIFNYDGFNRVMGFDGNLRFLDNYALRFQYLYYNTHELNDSSIYYDSERFDDGKHSAGFDGEKFSGIGGITTLRKSSRNWSFNINYEFNPPTARMDNGFISNNDYKKLYTWQQYSVYFDKGFLLRMDPGVFALVRHDYNGKLNEVFADFECYFQFKKQINAYLTIFLVNNEQVGGHYNTGAIRPSINFNINTIPEFMWGGFYSRGKSIVRFIEPSYVGYTQLVQFWSTFKPVDRFTLETNYSYAELANNSDLSDKLYAGYILRNKASYQFSKQLFLRLVAEYNSFGNTFQIDPLLSYKLNPFTIFYVGSTHGVENLPVPDTDRRRFVETERQIFLKFQYLWRL